MHIIAENSNIITISIDVEIILILDNRNYDPSILNKDQRNYIVGKIISL